MAAEMTKSFLDQPLEPLAISALPSVASSLGAQLSFDHTGARHCFFLASRCRIVFHRSQLVAGVDRATGTSE